MNYTACITSTRSIEESYKAITEDISNWWTPMSAKFLTIGDQAKTDFGVESYWVFEAKTLSPNSLIELLCIDSHMIGDFVKDPQEWRDTTLRFDIKKEGTNGSRITLTHVGLTPKMPCWDVCKKGWGHYILGSLQDYLDGKGGTPNSNEN
jgi:hypothetical protein